MANDDESDEDLVARAGRGDRAAASILIARHSPRILALCRRLLQERAGAQDAAQETFLKLWVAAPRWRPGGAQLSTWLYKVATNACFDRRRSAKRLAPESVDEPIDDAPSPLAVIAIDQRRRIIDDALAALPDRQRVAMTLRHFEGLSNIEIADVMSLSVEAVESLLSRGRRTMKEDLADRRDELMEAAE